jgi:hypothetical protein
MYSLVDEDPSDTIPGVPRTLVKWIEKLRIPEGKTIN